MCVCIYVCIYMSIYIYVCVHVYVYIKDVEKGWQSDKIGERKTLEGSCSK